MDSKGITTRNEACLCTDETAQEEHSSGATTQQHQKHLQQQREQDLPVSETLEMPIGGSLTSGHIGAWMDAGSVWCSVQRHGEELQRRQRQIPPPPLRRPSIVGVAATAVTSWSRGPLKRCLQRLRTHVVVTSRIAAKDPYTVVLPLLLMVAMMALGLWGVMSVANAICDGRRQSALKAATDLANALISYITVTVGPATTLKTLIQQQPSWDVTRKVFYEVAPTLLQKGKATEAILTIVLCPQGIASAIYPDLPLWQQVYGLDLLRNPSWRNDALKTVALHEQGMVMTGPSRLKAGMMGIVTRYAVFIDGANRDDTFGFNGSSFNCSPCYVPPTNSTAVGKTFWGFAQLNVDWEVLIRNVTSIYDLCDRFGLTFNMTYIDPVSFVNRSIASCGDVGHDPVVVSVDVMANHWVLAVGDSRGWSPEWLPLVVVVVVVVSVWMAVAMAIILINRREHMWLLQAMLPKKVIAALRRGEDYAEAFECVTVLFSDIVSYTTLASEMEPIKVVRLLNEMYNEFDALVDQFGCYKVETIGDAFMAVCGTQGEDAVAAAVKVARLAQAMIERTRVLESADGQKIQIRIGLHSGPVVGAVVGFKMPHFCLCGDTVNTASRMESNSQPMQIHISDTTGELLRRAAAQSAAGSYGVCRSVSGRASCEEGISFRLQRRGIVHVKGKGPMLTHWLLSTVEARDGLLEQEEMEDNQVVDAAAEAAAEEAGLALSTVSQQDNLSLPLAPRSMGDACLHLSGDISSGLGVTQAGAVRQRISDFGHTSINGGGTGGVNTKRQSASVDLRLFQSNGRRSKAKTLEAKSGK